MQPRDRYFVEGVSCLLDGQVLRVANLGLGGFFVASDAPPPLGQVVVADLRLPDGARCRVVGEVSWINFPGALQRPDLPPGFGVRLTGLAAQDRARIEHLLKRSDPVLGDPRPHG